MIEEQKRTVFTARVAIITRVPKTLVNKRKMDTPKDVHLVGMFIPDVI